MFVKSIDIQSQEATLSRCINYYEISWPINTRKDYKSLEASV